ncbi:pyridoxal 5'-phosphate synthase [Streptomyces sp. NPDC093109]|uniref:pyridoxine/pyridoxamine 5'-phosphate oxidase n=1 Tax=Streptomyces sp. NPDC093109 TaxID=3154977 RepID=UPI00344BFD3D
MSRSKDGYGPVARLLGGLTPLRRELPPFDAESAPSDPAELFVAWLTGAIGRGVLDPQAVTLSTVDADGAPDARIVILRDVDLACGSWVFASDSDSPKGVQLAANPAAALSLYWPLLGRQVRIRGTVRAWAPDDCAEEFRARPPLSKIASLVGRQSEPLGDPAEYGRAAARAAELLRTDAGTVPAAHTVYALRAREVEFWQADRERCHVRLRFVRAGDDGTAWDRTRLWP